MSHDDDEVPSKVLFKNRQWSVTDYGVESVTPGAPYHYHFDKSRVLEQGSFDGMYDWPVHMAEKTWIDMEAFIEAFVKAIDLHGYGQKVDRAMLDKSLERARYEASQR